MEVWKWTAADTAEATGMDMGMGTGRRAISGLLGVVLLSIGGAAEAVPIAVSSFDTGDEGWLVVSTEGYVGSPDWSPTGGNAGGYIYDTDMDNGGWGFLAPSKFQGDVSAAYGEKLTFDFASDRIEHLTAGVALADTSGVGIITYVDLPSAPIVRPYRTLGAAAYASHALS
jgi:hypothetical protein